MSLLRTALIVLASLASAAPTCLPGGKWRHEENHEGGGSFFETEAPPGLELQPGILLCTDPCEGGLTVFGPETFSRSACAPSTALRSFSLTAQTDLCLVVENDGTAAARIRVDGAEVVGPSAFNPHVTRITATLRLQGGEHELSVRMTSIPGTSITVELRACEQAPPEPPPCSEVATALCVAQGWSVGLSLEGGLICTAPGVGIHDNCATCEQYNLYVWSAGVGDPYCPRVYLTEPGEVYGGHEPCTCSNDLVECGAWELAGCVPD